MELNKIYNMDCIIGMQQMIKDGNVIDCVITSPPYNIVRPNMTDRGYDEYKDGMSNDEYMKWTISVFDCFDKLLVKNGKILYNMSYGSENTECMNLTIAEIITKTNFTIADIIVWEKFSAVPNNVSKNRLTRICEFVYVFCRKNELLTFNTNKKQVSKSEKGQVIYENIFNKIYAKNNDENCLLNKANFSTELVYKLMNIYCKNDDIILDTFMGTGTTAVACLVKGNPYIGFELSKNQYNWACDRINKQKSQCSLFDLI